MLDNETMNRIDAKVGLPQKRISVWTKNIEIFTRLWEHAENEVVEFKKAETNF